MVTEEYQKRAYFGYGSGSIMLDLTRPLLTEQDIYFYYVASAFSLEVYVYVYQNVLLTLTYMLTMLGPTFDVEARKCA